jgi:hypothetical protein
VGEIGATIGPIRESSCKEVDKASVQRRDEGRTVSILPESTLILDEICIGIAVRFVVDRVWRRGKEKTPIDQLGRDSRNV